MTVASRVAPAVSVAANRAIAAGSVAYGSAWLATLGVLALGYALFVGRGGPGPIPIVLLAVTLAAVVAATGGWSPAAFGRERSLRRLLGFGLAAQLALLLVWPLLNPLALATPAAYAPYWIGMAVAVILAATPVFGTAPTAWWRVGGLVAAHLAIGVWVIVNAPNPHIDVWTMQRDGAHALLNGINPYLPIYENIHGTDTTYYGPGLVVDGQLTIGFPYPPLSLLLVIPGSLVGDPRYALLVAMELAAIVMMAIRPGRIATGAGLLFLFMPLTFLMVVGGWTEPLGVLLLAVTLFAAVRAPMLLGLALGLLIAVKQYLLLGLPLAMLLLARRRDHAWRVGLQAVVVAAAITLPFVIWDMGAFAWSAVGSLAAQVFRSDSLTFLAVLPADVGPRLSILAFALLIPAGLLVLRRTPRSPVGFALSLGCLLLVFFAFSRQGSANYHYAVIGALCCAVALTEPAVAAQGAAT